MRVFTAAAGAALGATAVLASLAIPASASTGSPDVPVGSGTGDVSGDVRLDGGQEVPGPGDPDGSGQFQFKVKGHTLCYKLSVRDIRPPTSAHIHIAPKGEAGPVVVTLKTPPENGSVSDCIRAQKKQNPENAATVLTFWELKGIKEDLFLFYTNVHNQEFPAGAVRGQLS